MVDWSFWVGYIDTQLYRYLLTTIMPLTLCLLAKIAACNRDALLFGRALYALFTLIPAPIYLS